MTARDPGSPPTGDAGPNIYTSILGKVTTAFRNPLINPFACFAKRRVVSTSSLLFHMCRLFCACAEGGVLGLLASPSPSLESGAIQPKDRKWARRLYSASLNNGSHAMSLTARVNVVVVGCK